MTSAQPQQNPRSKPPCTSAASRRPPSRSAGGDLHADPFRSEAPAISTAAAVPSIGTFHPGTSPGV